MTQEKPSQSQSISGSFVFSSVGQAGNNLNQTQVNSSSHTEEQLTSAEAFEKLKEIEEIIQGAKLPEPEAGEAITYLNTAKIEVQKQKPNKNKIVSSLNKIVSILSHVTDVVKKTDETVEVSQRILTKVQLIVGMLLKWLGY